MHRRSGHKDGVEMVSSYPGNAPWRKLTNNTVRDVQVVVGFHLAVRAGMRVYEATKYFWCMGSRESVRAWLGGSKTRQRSLRWPLDSGQKTLGSSSPARKSGWYKGHPRATDLGLRSSYVAPEQRCRCTSACIDHHQPSIHTPGKTSEAVRQG